MCHGMVLFITGIVLFFFTGVFSAGVNENDFLSIIAFSGLITMFGVFIFFFGFESVKAAPFPFLFMLLSIPVPGVIINPLISFLQRGSTEAANFLFIVSRVPFTRNGCFFHLQGLTIEVAPECSGIRSGIALVITSILAGHIFLKTGWKKLLLSICAVPVTIFKNGVRITTLSLLGAYVNRDILSGNLHRQGGRPFFIVALILLIIVLLIIRKTEWKKKQSVKQSDSRKI